MGHLSWNGFPSIDFCLVKVAEVVGLQGMVVGRGRVGRHGSKVVGGYQRHG